MQPGIKPVWIACGVLKPHQSAVGSVTNTSTEAAPAVVRDTTPSFANKRDVAEMLGFSVRTVDNLMARGLPHYTVGKRRCRFDIAEVRDWFKQTYSAQRLGKGTL